MLKVVDWSTIACFGCLSIDFVFWGDFGGTFFSSIFTGYYSILVLSCGGFLKSSRFRYYSLIWLSEYSKNRFKKLCLCPSSDYLRSFLHCSIDSSSRNFWMVSSKSSISKSLRLSSKRSIRVEVKGLAGAGFGTWTSFWVTDGRAELFALTGFNEAVDFDSE